MITWDRFDDAIIGTGSRCNSPDVFIYSFNKMVKILVDEDDMTPEEAIDFIEYNVIGYWVGETTPIILRQLGYYEQDILDRKNESVFNEKNIDDKEIN
jgi:hypothetical protein